LSGGAGSSTNIFLTPRSGDATLRTGYRAPTGVERVVDDSEPLALNEEKHLAVVWDGPEENISMYLDGQLVTDNQTHFALTELVDNNNWLGRAQWPDTMYVGNYNEFRIYDYALTPDEVLGNFEAGPGVVTPEPSGLALLALGVMALLVRRRRY
jgi:hypothetical protein